ncbi:hypothetical protein [Tissierella sp.]|uniref:hypothetical protein n=1 Tax=Tissierella sp. TaxID=41274 RepID=UPI002863F8CB|nr:hypothetical protein [Tissierella sp.]MDR7855052.1 hypothetical protein [Tissierella sp.]
MEDFQLEGIKEEDFIVVNSLIPVGPAEQLFIAGVSVFEITEFTPPIQRVTILGINLPRPSIFGPYDIYVAVLTATGSSDPLATLTLIPTEDERNWVATTFLDFGGTLPNINVSVRPESFSNHIGNPILEGPVFD